MSEAQEQLIVAIESGDLAEIKRLHKKALQYFELFHIFEDEFDVRIGACWTSIAHVFTDSALHF